MSNQPEQFEQQEQFEPTFGCVYGTLMGIVGILCLIFGFTTVLPLALLFCMVFLPFIATFIALVCFIKFVVSVVKGELDE